VTFDDLVSAAFDRPLTPEERAELNRKIVEEPGCAERFATLARVHADLRGVHEVTVVNAARPTKRRRLPLQSRSNVIPWGWAAAAAILVALLLYQFSSTPENAPVRPTAAAPKSRPVDPPPVQPEPTPVVIPEKKEVPKEPEPFDPAQGKPVPPPVPVPIPPKEEPKPVVPAPLPEPKPEPFDPAQGKPVVPPPPAPKTTAAIANLGKLSGAVLRLGPEGAVRATEGMELLEGQGVEAPAGASASIVFLDKTSIDLEAGSRIENLQGRDAKRLVVKTGAIAAEVAAQPAGKPMVFVTPQAEAQVLGTTLRIVAEPKSTRLEVTEGKVRFTRLQDKKAVEVAGGFYAVAGPGIELKALPLPKTVALLSLPFEDGKTSPSWTGKVVPGPARAANRGALEGQYHPQDRLTRVKLAEEKGLFTHRKGADLSFDYWADGETAILSVYLWNRTQSLSMGGYEIRSLAKKQWTRVTISLADLRDGNKGLQDGDLVSNLTIQTNVGTGVLFIDNVEITAPRR